MRIIASPDAFGDRPCVLAMGKFDGVHRGHQAVLHEAVRIAKARGIESVALTFDRHPSAMTGAGPVPEALTPISEKGELIEHLGIDCLIVCAFTRALMAMEPDDFLRMIQEKLHPAAIVFGENFTFGRGARGDGQLLGQLAGPLGYEAIQVPMLIVDGDWASSTRARQLIGAGDYGAASRVLGRDTKGEG